MKLEWRTFVLVVLLVLYVGCIGACVSKEILYRFFEGQVSFLLIREHSCNDDPAIRDHCCNEPDHLQEEQEEEKEQDDNDNKEEEEEHCCNEPDHLLMQSASATYLHTRTISKTKKGSSGHLVNLHLPLNISVISIATNHCVTVYLTQLFWYTASYLSSSFASLLNKHCSRLFPFVTFIWILDQNYPTNAKKCTISTKIALLEIFQLKAITFILPNSFLTGQNRALMKRITNLVHNSSNCCSGGKKSNIEVFVMNMRMFRLRSKHPPSRTTIPCCST